jgi:hypothetical protein
MAGEIIKGTVNLNNIATAANGEKYPNQIAGYYSNDDATIVFNGVNANNQDIDSTDFKLAVEQGKAFISRQVTFDANITAANVDNIINDRINTWIATLGNRYDEIIITVNPSGGNHDIMVAIFRYF